MANGWQNEGGIVALGMVLDNRTFSESLARRFPSGTPKFNRAVFGHAFSYHASMGRKELCQGMLTGLDFEGGEEIEQEPFLALIDHNDSATSTVA